MTTLEDIFKNKMLAEAFLLFNKKSGGAYEVNAYCCVLEWQKKPHPLPKQLKGSKREDQADCVIGLLKKANVSGKEMKCALDDSLGEKRFDEAGKGLHQTLLDALKHFNDASEKEKHEEDEKKKQLLLKKLQSSDVDARMNGLGAVNAAREIVEPPYDLVVDLTELMGKTKLALGKNMGPNNELRALYDAMVKAEGTMVDLQASLFKSQGILDKARLQLM